MAERIVEAWDSTQYKYRWNLGEGGGKLEIALWEPMSPEQRAQIERIIKVVVTL